MKQATDLEPMRLRQRLDDADRERARAAQEDVIVEDPRRLMLRSPNGTYFAIRVSDDGELSTIPMGTKL